MSDWGLLPDDVYALISAREWHHYRHLQQRLSGIRQFPITISLKPPTDQQVLADITRYRHFVAAWQKFTAPDLVEWRVKNYRSLKNQQVPRRLMISSMQALLGYLGKDAVARSRGWEIRMQPLLHFNGDVYPVLIKHLRLLENMSPIDVDLLVSVLPQLSKDMGASIYLRALPLMLVDTKFVELFAPIITDLLDVIHQGQITQSGGLLAWLGCLENPTGWITVRPLCQESQARMGDYAILQLSVAELRRKVLPAENILVVENLQSGLGLTHLKNTIAVFGGGRNVSWMNAKWLADKNLGYWGDIDTWGLAILSQARTLAFNLDSIMMDRETLIQFKNRMVHEAEKCPSLPTHLTDVEKNLFRELQNNVFGAGRLEQERLPADYCREHFLHWRR